MNRVTQRDGFTQLKEKLWTTLPRRTTRQLELTKMGATFLLRARAILTSLDEAEE